MLKRQVLSKNSCFMKTCKIQAQGRGVESSCFQCGVTLLAAARGMEYLQESTIPGITPLAPGRLQKNGGCKSLQLRAEMGVCGSMCDS